MTKTLVLLTCALMLPLVSSAANSLFENFNQWKLHYKVTEPYTKITDNKGLGSEELYGTRNFRVVLHGVFYRGGANNMLHRENPRDNMNPLQADGLKNICQQGFSTAIYLYSTNYETAEKITECSNGSENNKLDYKQINAFNSGDYLAILQLIQDRIKGKLPGPIYGHCWNGMHASGLIAAVSLRQFCDWTAEETLEYWRKNTDGHIKGYEKVEKLVLNFKTIDSLKISAEEQAAICPEKVVL